MLTQNTARGLLQQSIRNK